MSGFSAVTYPYAPLLALLAGLATLLSYWGIGTLLLRAGRFSLPSPWQQVVATLIGCLVAALVVELLAMGGFATGTFLIPTWAGMVLVGLGCLLLALRPTKSSTPAAIPTETRVEDRICVADAAIPAARSLPTAIQVERGSSALSPSLPCAKPGLPSGVLWVPLGIGLVVNGVNLLIALAPSSKMDELFYHMLVPSRIVHDGGLCFYRHPWWAAVLPQMHYQIAGTPLYALGLPDAPNVVSWGLSVLFQWFAWKVLAAREEARPFAAVLVVSFVVGMYPAVCYVTGGSHILGDLATTVGVVALLRQAELRPHWGDSSWLLTCSVAAVAAASSKASLVPLSAMIVLLAVTLTCWPPLAWRTVVSRLGVAALPWLAAYLPLAIWTFAASGSPFGPMFCDRFGWSVYDVEEMKAVFRQTFETNHFALSYYVPIVLASYSVLVWMGMLVWPFVPGLDRITRGLGLLLLLLQVGILLFVVGYDVRYLGGLHYGLAVALACQGLPWVENVLLTRTGLLLASGVFLLPWAAGHCYYGAQFVPVSLGLQDRESFVRAKTAFRVDFQEIDRLVPPDAVLLVACGRMMDSVYAPRLPIFHVADLPGNRPAYLFTVRGIGSEEAPPGFTRGPLIYENPNAIIQAFRTPGRAPWTGCVRVYRLDAQG